MVWSAEARRRGRQSQCKMDYYRKVMCFCHDPECAFGYGLEVHHIQPLSKGGNDTYANYIVLCAACHRKRGVHTQWSEHQIRLLTYKFYEERLRIGVTSDDSTELEFHNALVKYACTLDLKPNEKPVAGEFLGASV